jgi:hypothetical protein
MALSRDSLLQKVEERLTLYRRKLTHVTALKSSISGLLLGAFLVALYITVWPQANEKIRILATNLTELMSTFSLAVVIIITALWLLSSVVLSFTSFIYLRERDKHSRKVYGLTELSPVNFLLHLNRQHPSLEESAHLLANEAGSLSILQTMQLARINSSLEAIISSPVENGLPKVSLLRLYIKNVYALIGGLVLLISALMVTNSWQHLPANSTAINSKSIAEADLNYTATMLVKVIPPVYTQQVPFEQDDLNISVLEGSQIQWLIPFAQNDQANDKLRPTFTLLAVGKEPVTFSKTEIGYTATLTATIATVYSIAQTSEHSSFTTDIATIIVRQDTSPSIVFNTPKLTITEIPKNVISSIPVEVEISDDFGISEVKIVASIAKGSGEAVKFRDQEFSFDSVTVEGDKALYTKNWDLQGLEMSPGDELYFSVHASDNKSPTRQKTVSPIKIIRWLEDEEASVSGEGIVIDFMPEYFKSQQQIIIETQALIAQLPSLSTSEIKRISRGLGIDQSDLKQSYGQYLGDEFESGIVQNMEAGPEMPDIDEHSHGHAEEHSESEHSGDDHGHGEQADNSNDLSGYQQAIEQFGHNHGEADIGFIKTSQGQINPKVLMKRAIAAMWQAELHLQLSEPKLALPYEKEALNYLNRAKQAERIYVKRLGFEPPPVTEERRYAGKLEDILSYKRETIAELTPSQNSHFVALVARVNNYLTLSYNENEKLSNETRLLIENVVLHLSEKLSKEPEWITQLATLKRIQIADSFKITDCLNCLQSLITALSSHISSPIAQAYTPTKIHSANLPFVRAYAEALLNDESSLNKSEKQFQQGNQP